MHSRFCLTSHNLPTVLPAYILSLIHESALLDIIPIRDDFSDTAVLPIGWSMKLLYIVCVIKVKFNSFIFSRGNSTIPYTSCPERFLPVQQNSHSYSSIDLTWYMELIISDIYESSHHDVDLQDDRPLLQCHPSPKLSPVGREMTAIHLRQNPTLH